eukprot:TRINITY_DN78241_c0_g3_i3.p1 TRINITY_DN78241_c0_g3~~TRINITY_DN78241_c0_g3_i3.p1  ORF type:complete len:764 (-),score=110.32 TRINITY_DN78241_c0_g3_i3:122-2230(-)
MKSGLPMDEIVSSIENWRLDLHLLKFKDTCSRLEQFRSLLNQRIQMWELDTLRSIGIRYLALDLPPERYCWNRSRISTAVVEALLVPYYENAWKNEHLLECGLPVEATRCLSGISFNKLALSKCRNTRLEAIGDAAREGYVNDVMESFRMLPELLVEEHQDDEIDVFGRRQRNDGVGLLTRIMVSCVNTFMPANVVGELWRKYTNLVKKEAISQVMCAMADKPQYFNLFCMLLDEGNHLEGFNKSYVLNSSCLEIMKHMRGYRAAETAMKNTTVLPSQHLSAFLGYCDFTDLLESRVDNSAIITAMERDEELGDKSPFNLMVTRFGSTIMTHRFGDHGDNCLTSYIRKGNVSHKCVLTLEKNFETGLFGFRDNNDKTAYDLSLSMTCNSSPRLLQSTLLNIIGKIPGIMEGRASDNVKRLKAILEKPTVTAVRDLISLCPEVVNQDDSPKGGFLMYSIKKKAQLGVVKLLSKHMNDENIYKVSKTTSRYTDISNYDNVLSQALHNCRDAPSRLNIFDFLMNTYPRLCNIYKMENGVEFCALGRFDGLSYKYCNHAKLYQMDRSLCQLIKLTPKSYLKNPDNAKRLFNQLRCGTQPPNAIGCLLALDDGEVKYKIGRYFSTEKLSIETIGLLRELLLTDRVIYGDRHFHSLCQNLFCASSQHIDPEYSLYAVEVTAIEVSSWIGIPDKAPQYIVDRLIDMTDD